MEGNAVHDGYRYLGPGAAPGLRGQHLGGAVSAFLTELRDGGDTTVVLTTHDLSDIERLCRRLVVIDHGHVVHDGTLESLHARYGSRRTVVVTLEEPLVSPVRLAGVDLTDSSVDGRVLTFSLDGSRTPAGSLVARLAQLGAPLAGRTPSCAQGARRASFLTTHLSGAPS